MKKEERSKLDDNQMLFTLITALVKRAGGEIRISEEEMDSVIKQDVMMMYYDKEASEIILTIKLLGAEISGEQ